MEMSNKVEPSDGSTYMITIFIKKYAYMTEVNSLNTVAHLVQRRRPAHHAHDIGDN